MDQESVQKQEDKEILPLEYDPATLKPLHYESAEKTENKFRFTRDGRLIDGYDALAWKLERVPDTIIPESLSPFIRCPIYFTRDDRSEEIKKIEAEEQGLEENEMRRWAGDYYLKDLDIIILSPYKTDTPRWKTALAHEVGHSILHREDTDKPYQQKEQEADDFVREYFAKESWIDQNILHGGK